MKQDKKSELVKTLSEIGLYLVLLILVVVLFFMPLLISAMDEEKLDKMRAETYKRFYESIEIGMTEEQVDQIIFEKEMELTDKPKPSLAMPESKWIEAEEQTSIGLQTTIGYLTFREFEYETFLGTDTEESAFRIFVGFTDGVVTKKDRE